ncbi:MAG: DUF4286 family protein [Marinicaulis sp.]|nr:DUF4286 family protein [Marinicaulis sp.]
MAGGILYEVNVTLAPDIREAYAKWLGAHVDEMLSIDGFIGASVYVDTEDDCKMTAHYILRDQAALDSYLAEHAPHMREDGVKHFGDKFKATRRVMQTLG